MGENGEHRSIPQKSPNYPNISLEEALAKVKVLYDKDGKAGAPKKIALQHLGYNTESGPALRTLSALKKFDLIVSNQGRMVPSQRAIELLVYPKDSERYLSALKGVALNPSVYRRLWNKYKDGFPSDEALKAELIDEQNFNPKQVDGFLKDFRKTLEFARLAPGEEQPPEEEINEEEEMPDQVKQDSVCSAGSRPMALNVAKLPNAYSIPLKNNQAMLSFGTLPVTKADLEKIKKWIDLFEDSLVDDRPDLFQE